MSHHLSNSGNSAAISSKVRGELRLSAEDKSSKRISTEMSHQDSKSTSEVEHGGHGNEFWAENKLGKGEADRPGCLVRGA